MSVIRIADFDTWRPGYGQATVRVLQADSSNLASVYSDEELTVPVANPQTLLEKTLQGVSYGKFAQPVYIGVPYQLEINSVDGTGIIRPPIDTLVGQDASEPWSKYRAARSSQALLIVWSGPLMCATTASSKKWARSGPARQQITPHWFRPLVLWARRAAALSRYRKETIPSRP